MKDLNDMSKTILFDIGESTVHSDSYDTLQKMKEDLNLIQNKLKGEGASIRAAIKILELVK